MMKVKVEGLRAALKKVKGFSGESLVMEFMTRAAGEGEERYLKIDASNGTAQSSILATYVGDNEEAKKYIVSSSIVDVVESISAFGDEITVEPLDSCLKLECGGAVVPVGFLKDATILKMTNLKNVEKLQVRLKSEDFANLIAHGGFATGDSTIRMPIFNGTVVLTPCVDGEKLSLRALSCCGVFIAAASAEIETTDSATFNKYAGVVEGESQKSVAINYASLLALTKRIISENVDLIITDKQVIVRDGADAYLFTVIEGQVPQMVVDFVVNEVQTEFEYTLDRDTLKKAIAVVGLTGERAARLSFSGETLTIEDMKHTSRAAVPVTAVKDSKVEVMLDANFVKNIASTMPAELTVYGPAGGKGIYFEGIGSKAYLLPIKE